MKNVKMNIKGKILTVEIDLSERHGLSKTGNTMTIATTQGNVPVGQGDIKLGLNVYTKEGVPAKA